MQKLYTRPSLLRRLAASAAIECSLAFVCLVLAAIGLRSFFDFQSSTFADKIVPLPFMFGVWPFVILAALAVGIAGWAVHKAR